MEISAAKKNEIEFTTHKFSGTNAYDSHSLSIHQRIAMIIIYNNSDYDNLQIITNIICYDEFKIHILDSRNILSELNKIEACIDN
jgi:hypothetical protein